ncbi:MAG: nucleotide exchange factor GrpE [Gammaproteobacteria bacterium]|nr:nucleotide exchange factor GrpE [Gammaproteobacteria bacterium]
MSTDKKKPDGAPEPESADADDKDPKQDASPETPVLTQAERELVDAQEKVDENWELYLRTAAELENVRKRSQRELENARRYGIERFALELLAVGDSLEMGLEAASEEPSVEILMAGKKATLKQLRQLLERFSISELDPLGEAFDPELHEAMTTQPSDEYQPGQVMAVIQKGYRIHDRLLRPARVIIATEAENQEA